MLQNFSVVTILNLVIFSSAQFFDGFGGFPGFGFDFDPYGFGGFGRKLSSKSFDENGCIKLLSTTYPIPNSKDFYAKICSDLKAKVESSANKAASNTGKEGEANGNSISSDTKNSEEKRGLAVDLSKCTEMLSKLSGFENLQGNDADAKKNCESLQNYVKTEQDKAAEGGKGRALAETAAFNDIFKNYRGGVISIEQPDPLSSTNKNRQ